MAAPRSTSSRGAAKSSTAGEKDEPIQSADKRLRVREKGPDPGQSSTIEDKQQSSNPFPPLTQRWGDISSSGSEAPTPKKGSEPQKRPSKGAGKGKTKQQKSGVSQDQSKGSTKGPEWTSFMVDHKAPGFELRSPRKKLPLWGKRDEFMDKLQKFQLMIAKCPTGSGKSTTRPMLAVQLLKPNAGCVICTQIRRATTQSVWKSTCDVWAINKDEGKFVGFRHGTEKTENWDRNDTRVLFVMEGILT